MDKIIETQTGYLGNIRAPAVYPTAASPARIIDVRVRAAAMTLEYEHELEEEESCRGKCAWSSHETTNHLSFETGLAAQPELVTARSEFELSRPGSGRREP